MTTHYIDKRNTYNGDGTAPTPATVGGGAGAYNRVDEVCDPSGLTDGDTVVFVAGSGPYFQEDFTHLSTGRFYLRQAAGEYVWLCNNNVFTSETFLNAENGFEWHQSSVDGLYYVTASGGLDPAFTRAAGSGVVDGVWDTFSTSLNEADSTTPNHIKKWGWGDDDSLGFYTVYVRGVDPINDNPDIRVAIEGMIFEIPVVGALHKFYTAEFRGGYNQMGAVKGSAEFYNCTLENANNAGFEAKNSASASMKFYSTIFRNCGHEAFSNVYAGATAEAYHCFFQGVHTITKLDTPSTTVTVKNSASKDLLAGAFQVDDATCTIVEDHNQYHIDPDSAHSGKALAFTTGTRQWTQTAATDLPASTATSLGTSVDPKVASDGRLLSDSPCIRAGGWITGVNQEKQTDIVGKMTYGAPSMGPNFSAGVPKRGERGFGMLGGGMFL